MRRGDPHDPLLRQVLPLGAETAAGARLSSQTRCSEAAARDAPGAAAQIPRARAADHHRRLRRALPLLLPPRTTTTARPGRRGSGALADGPGACCAATPSIEEMILSGGDPLSLGNARLAELLRSCARMPQLRTPAHPHAHARWCCPRASMPACWRALRRLPRRSWSSSSTPTIASGNRRRTVAGAAAAARDRARSAAEPVGAAARA